MLQDLPKDWQIHREKKQPIETQHSLTQLLTTPQIHQTQWYSQLNRNWWSRRVTCSEVSRGSTVSRHNFFISDLYLLPNDLQKYGLSYLEPRCLAGLHAALAKALVSFPAIRTWRSAALAACDYSGITTRNSETQLPE